MIDVNLRGLWPPWINIDHGEGRKPGYPQASRIASLTAAMCRAPAEREIRRAVR
jgi:hypothetical protein